MKLKMKGMLPALVAGAMAVGIPAFAHHSFPATYHIDKQEKIEGRVVQFLFRNPHSLIHVMAPDKDGKEQRWAIEWAAAGALAREGAGRDTLKIGDKVVIVGNPGRNPTDFRMRLNSIERPADGWRWAGEFD